VCTAGVFRAAGQAPAAPRSAHLIPHRLRHRLLPRTPVVVHPTVPEAVAHDGHHTAARQGHHHRRPGVGERHRNCGCDDELPAVAAARPVPIQGGVRGADHQRRRVPYAPREALRRGEPVLALPPSARRAAAAPGGGAPARVGLNGRRVRGADRGRTPGHGRGAGRVPGRVGAAHVRRGAEPVAVPDHPLRRRLPRVAGLPRPVPARRPPTEARRRAAAGTVHGQRGGGRRGREGPGAAAALLHGVRAGRAVRVGRASRPHRGGRGARLPLRVGRHQPGLGRAPAWRRHVRTRLLHLRRRPRRAPCGHAVRQGQGAHRQAQRTALGALAETGAWPVIHRDRVPVAVGAHSPPSVVSHCTRAAS
jgi:hypothetical protein